ncbi:MAG TPA: pyruvate kinase [Bacillota bacterium]|nr:pyruvate kinase [Peptococcaceae bacterium]HPZ43672.1 pyruvate kinase [Bacillota bacterium]HQD76543.1 pyruvate kinase [Bacillota bacterium]HUM58848.1 pyruvate kinase [Bacillota bacterium]
MRKTKIVCTIGPASDDLKILKGLLLSGMNVARLNFSHGTHEEHARRIAMIRRAAEETEKNVALMLDTKGPEIRLGFFKEEPVYLEQGARVTLTTEVIKGDRERIPVTYGGLPGDIRKGDTILLDDGLIELEVLSVLEKEILCRVVNGGKITSQKGVNVPGVKLNLPALTDKDIEDIKFGIEHNFDFLAASFVRKAADVLEIRKVLEEGGAQIDIISKIENREAVQNLEEIVKVSDGVMVARGDLGVEIPVEEVPLVQKTIIKLCNRSGKPVVTATQMLESMIHNPRPTRAEASDVANAIFDGTDAVMLSGETAVGKYPVEAVRTMARIAERAEAALHYGEILAEKRFASQRTVTDAISYASCATAQDLGAAAIITSTESGHTARMVSKYRPQAPVVAVTPHASVMRKLALIWGVQPLLAMSKRSTDEMMSTAVEASLKAGLIKGGDLVVLTAGVPVGVPGTTNLIRVLTVGDILARGTGIGSKAVTGPVRLARTAREALEKVQTGDILVTIDTDSDYIPAIQKAGAVVTEVGGLTSHAAIVCLEFGKPVIVGVEGASVRLPDGETVTVDGLRGLIYKGTARVL